MAKIQTFSGGYSTLRPEVVEVAPLNQVNSTAYTVKVEFDFNAVSYTHLTLPTKRIV